MLQQGFLVSFLIDASFIIISYEKINEVFFSFRFNFFIFEFCFYQSSCSCVSSLSLIFYAE